VPPFHQCCCIVPGNVATTENCNLHPGSADLDSWESLFRAIPLTPRYLRFSV
jgi:hypothetical protein